MKILNSLFFCLFFAINCLAIEPINTKVNNQLNPLGIDIPIPEFSWTLTSSERGSSQSAWEIVVSDNENTLNSGKKLTWESGKVTGSQFFGVVYKGQPLKPFTRYFWKVRVWDQNGKESKWSNVSWFETSMLSTSDWKAQWISDTKPLPAKDEDFYKPSPNPLLRKEFNLKKEIQSARLYITGLGYYTAGINGERVGDHMLDVPLTQYSKQVMYSTYDVTALFHKGTNAIGVSLGNGWYNPMPIRLFRSTNLREAMTVGKPCLKAQIRVTYTDGSIETIVSDQSWKAGEGPVLMNSVYLGETYDARLEQKGWDRPGFNDSKWTAAKVVNGPSGKLAAQDIPPIRITKILKPVKITEPAPGIYLFDFGQVFAGVPRLRVNGPAGKTITLREGEDIHADGSLNFLTVITGQLKAMWNLRGGPGCPDNPMNIITYTLKGNGEEIYTPQFTFSSFRYVEVSGFPGKPGLDALEGLRMNTDVEETGSFECSNPMFNQLHEAVKWTFQSNIFSIQSDCPAREKFGYGADIVATTEAFCYNYDMSRFYRKIARDFVNDVRPKGGMPEIAPYNGLAIKGIGDQSGPLGWQLAFPYSVKQVYDFYGDKAFVEQNYEILKRQVEFIRSVYPDNIVPQDISDHESIDEKPEAFTATCFYLQHVNILLEWGELLQKQSDVAEFKKLAEDIRQAAIRKFGKGDGIFDNGTQAAQLFALYHNTVSENEKQAAFKHLLEEIYLKHKGHLSTGIFATKYLFDISRIWNRNDVAYSVANQRSFPGYGYMLDHGATTLWESWEYPDTVNSQNHPMFGSVDEWFYRSLLGINSITPGFRTFHIKPQPAGDLYWAKGYYDSQSGRITSEWNSENTIFKMRVGIPANTTALVYVPSLPGRIVKEGEQDAKSVQGLQFKEYKDGYAVFQANAGNYSFTSIFQKQ